jgi:hypothetical protein
MLVLECILGLCSKQIDITCAFLHASLGKDEAVYIEMPQVFKQYNKIGKPKVLKLNRTLYGYTLKVFPFGPMYHFGTIFLSFNSVLEKGNEFPRRRNAFCKKK